MNFIHRPLVGRSTWADSGSLRLQLTPNGIGSEVLPTLPIPRALSAPAHLLVGVAQRPAPIRDEVTGVCLTRMYDDRQQAVQVAREHRAERVRPERHRAGRCVGRPRSRLGPAADRVQPARHQAGRVERGGRAPGRADVAVIVSLGCRF